MQQEALRIAKATQKKALTKEQTKLIAQGIEKGISEYKKQQKAKARERDKQRKKQSFTNAKNVTDLSPQPTESKQQTSKLINSIFVFLPWVLLLASWAYFFIAV